MKNLLLLFLSIFLFTQCGDEGLSGSDTSGINGSYSQIVVSKDFLYGINNNQLTTLNIADKDDVKTVDVQILDYDIESIFINSNTMFVGSASRMYIFELEEETGIPVPLSQQEYNASFFEEEVICTSDPIVATQNFAYVTLQTVLQDQCRNVNINQLRIYDISDLQAPQLLSTTEMVRPKGLGIVGNTLFVCDGNNGLKIYDVSDPLIPIEKYHFPGFDSYDLIARNGLLLVVAEDQLLQYDFQDLNNIYLLGTIDL